MSLTDDTVVIDTTGAEVAAIDGDYNQPETWPVMEANARLIAAAPDLLSSLKATLAVVIAAYGERLSGSSGSHATSRMMTAWHEIEVARAAIAKAEGAQP